MSITAQVSQSDDESLKFNPYSSAFRQDPYSYYAKLRQQAPVLALGNDMYMITRYADIRSLMSNSSTSVRYIPDSVSELGTGEIPHLVELGNSAIVFTDPPQHARLRKLMNKGFSRSSINEFSDLIELTVAELLGSHLDDEPFDFVGEVAHQVPLQTISRLLGVVGSKIAELDQQLLFLRQILDPSLHTARRIKKFETTFAQCSSYFEQLIKDRAQSKCNNILSRLIDSRLGEDQLSSKEIVVGCVLTYIAGHETTKSVISSGVAAFAENPEQWDLLRNNPALLAPAIEEILRYEAPLQQTMRVLNEEVQIGDYQLKKGDKLLLCMGSGNRDESVFSNPDKFDINRAAHGNLAFGMGLHNCIGQHLAKSEAMSVFSYLIKQVSRFEIIDESALQWSNQGIITRSLQSLPIRFITAAQEKVNGL
jgi:cytochrome P450